MKQKLALAFILMATVAGAQTYNLWKRDTINRADVNGVRNGFWKICVPAVESGGKITSGSNCMEEGYYLNGKREGTWLIYHSNFKTVHFSRTYHGDTLNGPCITYDVNGVKLEEYTMTGKAQVGYRRWYAGDNGKKNTFLLANGDTINRLDSAGVRQGYWIVYGIPAKGYRDTVKSEEGEYRDGYKTGKWVKYYPSGKKESECLYINKHIEGKFRSWHENGHLKEEGYWKNNRFVGEYKLYYDNDSLRQHFVFDSLGRRSGQALYYFPNGQLYLSTSFSEGKEEGWHREYTESGKLLKEEFYTNGTADPSKKKEYPQHPYHPDLAPPEESKN